MMEVRLVPMVHGKTLPLKGLHMILAKREVERSLCRCKRCPLITGIRDHRQMWSTHSIAA